MAVESTKQIEPLTLSIRLQIITSQRDALSKELLDAKAQIEEVRTENQILRSTLKEITNKKGDAPKE